MSNQPAVISRAEAKALGFKRYFTGKPCKHGHVAERHASNGKCVECMAAHNSTSEHKTKLAAYSATPEQKAKRAAWRASPKGKVARAAYNASPKGKAARAAYNARPERKVKIVAYNASPEGKAAQAAYNTGPKSKAKRAIYNATPKGRAAKRKNQSKRRALKRACEVLRTAEADARVKAMHFEATRLTIETGIVHHVDHITPLTRGGPDHPDNLQVVPYYYNLAKSNLTEEEMCDAILTGERPLRSERTRIQADNGN